MFSAQVSNAAPLAYDEAVDGDLADSFAAALADPFLLGPGVNTITGTSIEKFSIFEPDRDRDFFVFAPLGGHRVSDVQIAFTTLDVILGSLATLEGNFAISGFDPGFSLVYAAVPPSVDLLAGVPASTGLTPADLPVLALPGVIYFTSLSFPGSGVPETEFRANYTFSFTVESVPLPMPAALLFGGLAGLAAVRRARRR